MLNLDQDDLKKTSIPIPVEFVDVKEFYSYDKDLVIYYKLVGYRPRKGDRIGIFRLGWSYVRDYVLFEWQSLNNFDTSQSITFSRYNLPSNATELYQVCYINAENELLGASTPFQFASSKAIDNIEKYKFNPAINILSDSALNERKKDLEILRLKEENAMLKESLKMSFEQNKFGSLRNHESFINELRENMENLQNKLEYLENKFNQIEFKTQTDDMTKPLVEKKLFSKSLPPGDLKKYAEFDELQKLPPFPLMK